MSELGVGFFGKVPQLGDFVERGFHAGFLSCWDKWLQESIAASQAALGPSWLDIYLTSPAWRFAISSGVCGDAAYAGVMVPSVDKVGRYFPLAIVAAAPPATPVLLLLVRGSSWFDEVERVLREQLEREDEGVDEFERAVERLVQPLENALSGLRPLACLNTGVGLRLPLEGIADAGESLGELAAPLAIQALGPLSAWLTEGSPQMNAALLLTSNMPQPRSYVSMLNGGFESAQWQTLPTSIRGAAAALPRGVFTLSHAISTDPGHVRSANEDCAWGDPQLGVWVVADGMGGHAGGERASAAVCAALSREDWTGDLDDCAVTAKAALLRVNAKLRSQQDLGPEDIAAATTAVVLLIRGAAMVCLWAGDSRLYRVRDGMLLQLTRDHSTGSRAAVAGEDEYFVTSGIGALDRPSIDMLRDDVRENDVFALCTDGLYESVSMDVLQRGLMCGNAESSVRELMDQTLQGPAADNATVAVVRVETPRLASPDRAAEASAE